MRDCDRRVYKLLPARSRSRILARSSQIATCAVRQELRSGKVGAANQTLLLCSSSGSRPERADSDDLSRSLRAIEFRGMRVRIPPLATTRGKQLVVA